MEKDILSRGMEKIVGGELLEKKLKSGKALRIKHGVDPTTADLHLGHSVIYLKLKEFQKLGHKIVFLIGDFTGRFGDPSDKIKSRILRSKEEVRKVARNYINQVGKIIDVEKAEIRYNGEWYDKMSAEDLLHLMSKVSHAEMIERDMFQERMKKGERIGLHELVYPVLQGYDSAILHSDLTVCGSDQLFNELQGRKSQELSGQEPQAIITVPLLIGIDGRNKMSQSLGNHISLGEFASEQFGKIMSIPDNLIIDYLTLCTRIPMAKIELWEKEMKAGRNPKEIKVNLAKEIVGIYHKKEEAEKAAKEFEQVFQKKELPDNILEIKLSGTYPLPRFLVEAGLASSGSEARRLIEAGAVEIDGAKCGDYKSTITTHSGMVIKVGKRRFAKIK